MDLAAGQFPHQPGIDGAEKQISCFRFLLCPFHMIQDPFDLGRAEICIRDQTRALTDLFLHVGRNGVNDRCRSAALPNNGIIDRFACIFIPDDRCFSLIGDADAGQVFRIRTDLGKCLDCHGCL